MLTPITNYYYRTYFSQNVIPSTYDELFEDIKIKISAANYLSLTTDIWTADTAKIAFLSITGHWIDPTKFPQETVVLRVIFRKITQVFI